MMTEISAKDVMKLRQETGMGMMECKKALIQAGGDMAQAKEILRESMKGKMEARTERATAEGRIGIATDNARAAIIEVRTETDFAAKNEEFAVMVEEIAQHALSQTAGPVAVDDSITKRIDDVRLTTKENVNFARGEKLEGGTFGTYLHHDGKRGAVIQVEGGADAALLRNICQHIVAHVPPPVAVDENDMPADALAQVRAEAQKEAEASGKPAEIAQKIAEGKVRKYLEVNTLLEQKYIRDDTKSVRDILPPDIKVKRFVRYTVGQE